MNSEVLKEKKNKKKKAELVSTNSCNTNWSQGFGITSSFINSWPET